MSGIDSSRFPLAGVSPPGLDAPRALEQGIEGPDLKPSASEPRQWFDFSQWSEDASAAPLAVSDAAAAAARSVDDYAAEVTRHLLA